jgi:hypothetical protein
MKLRPDLLDAKSPEGIEVVQLTDEVVPSSHVYMEAQIFTPDSKRLVLHRSAHAHGSDKHDPEHRYLVCDLDDGCVLRPITEELGAKAPSVSPDGRVLYYVIDELDDAGGRIALKRVNLDGTDRRTLAVVDDEIQGTGFRPAYNVYSLSTIRSDGKRLASQVGLRDVASGELTFGLLVFDLESGGVSLIHHGPTWFNMHPQYSRSTDAEAMRDIMIQHNHSTVDRELVGPLGADIHCIRDDGTRMRSFPCGRDGNERCHGHQCWRGRSTFGILGTDTKEPAARHLIECEAVPSEAHEGLRTPGGARNDLSRAEGFPRSAHFGVDIDGTRLLTDSAPYDAGCSLVLAELGAPGKDAFPRWTWLFSPRCTFAKESHVHPFLSPDGTTGFFNSDESGMPQAYMVRGLDAV